MNRENDDGPYDHQQTEASKIGDCVIDDNCADNVACNHEIEAQHHRAVEMLAKPLQQFFALPVEVPARGSVSGSDGAGNDNQNTDGLDGGAEQNNMLSEFHCNVPFL